MTESNQPTHRAYCLLRRGPRQPGEWMLSGIVRKDDNGKDLRLYLSMLPVSGFDGHVLLRPIDAKPHIPLPPPDEPDMEEADDRAPPSPT